MGIPCRCKGGNSVAAEAGLFSAVLCVDRVNQVELEQGEVGLAAEQKRAHPGLNQGPLGLQPNALPLSYRPLLRHCGNFLIGPSRPVFGGVVCG